MSIPHRYRVKEVKVIDGDTVDLTLDLGFYAYTQQRFRLDGLNTPEMNSKDPSERVKAAEVKNFVIRVVGAATCIEVTSTRTEKYGRWLAELWLDGVSLNNLLLGKGLAIPYSGGSRSN